MSITLQDIKREVLALAKENPNFVYNPDYDQFVLSKCSYYQGAKNGPECDGCIFGQALQRLGLSKNSLEELGLGSIVHFLYKLQKGDYVEYTDEEYYELAPIFNEVQQAQDTGSSWGTAVKPLTE